MVATDNITCGCYGLHYMWVLQSVSHVGVTVCITCGYYSLYYMFQHCIDVKGSISLC